MMSENRVKSIQAWRQLRRFSTEELARVVGTGARTIEHWERAGYDYTARCAIPLADALQTPVDTIDFGHYVRSLELPGLRVILAARGRDDWGWKARVVEWQAGDPVDPWFAQRADAGWLELGPTAEAALDRVEAGIRAAVTRRANSCPKR